MTYRGYLIFQHLIWFPIFLAYLISKQTQHETVSDIFRIFHTISMLMILFSNTHSFLRVQSSHLQTKIIISIAWQLVPPDVNPITMISWEILIWSCSDDFSIHSATIAHNFSKTCSVFSQKVALYILPLHYIVYTLHQIFSYVQPIFNRDDTVEDFPTEISDFSSSGFATYQISFWIYLPSTRHWV